MNSINVLFFRI